MTSPVEILPTRTDWRSQLRDCVRSGGELLELLSLSSREVNFSERAAADFPLRVPREFVRRMQPGNPRDPLLLQVLALGEETLQVPGFTEDPVGETGGANPAPGIIHKYRGRALLIVSGACAINCRYCFRRHFPYGVNQNSRSEWRRALEYVAADEDISEIILSGGDPLVLDDVPLADLVDLIEAIRQVKRLRIHTRLPVVIPDRVEASLLDAICRDDLQTVVVIHSNHGNEIDAGVRHALGAFRRAGVTVLNQSVLLAGINDDADSLVDLSERLFAAGALPYYLHLLDPVQGAAHFDVTEARGRQLIKELAGRLPGYLVPRLVREHPGGDSKTVLGPG